MTVNESISVLIDGLIVATRTTSNSFKPNCSVLKDAQTEKRGRRGQCWEPGEGTGTLDVTQVQISTLFQHVNNQTKVN